MNHIEIFEILTEHPGMDFNNAKRRKIKTVRSTLYCTIQGNNKINK